MNGSVFVTCAGGVPELMGVGGLRGEEEGDIAHPS